MKAFRAVLAGLALAGMGVAHADQVVEQVPDTMPGKGYGGLTGMMVGAAAGGPIGAIVGALAGAWAGGATQDALGMSGNAYRVERADGSETVVRTPGETWAAGDSVTVVDRRLVKADGTLSQR